MGRQEKLYPPSNVSVSQQRRPQLLSAKFENLVHSIFRNETSTLEINVSHFGVLHWLQWQPPASAPKFQISLPNMQNYKYLFPSLFDEVNDTILQNLLQKRIEKDTAWAIAEGLPDKEK